MLICGFLSTGHKSESSEEETSLEKMLPSHWPKGKSVRHFLDWQSLWVSAVYFFFFCSVPGQVVLSCVTMQSEQAMRSNPVASTSLWPLLQLLPWVSVLTSFHAGL